MYFLWSSHRDLLINLHVRIGYRGPKMYGVKGPRTGPARFESSYPVAQLDVEIPGSERQTPPCLGVDIIPGKQKHPLCVYDHKYCGWLRNPCNAPPKNPWFLMIPPVNTNKRYGFNPGFISWRVTWISLSIHIELKSTGPEAHRKGDTRSHASAGWED